MVAEHCPDFGRVFLNAIRATDPASRRRYSFVGQGLRLRYVID